MNISTTFALLAIELVLIVYCYFMQKRPANLARPRILPHSMILAVTTVFLLGTIAHLLFLVTGNPIRPRTSKFG